MSQKARVRVGGGEARPWSLMEGMHGSLLLKVYRDWKVVWLYEWEGTAASSIKGTRKETT